MTGDKNHDEYVVIRHRPGYRLRRTAILLVFSVVSAVLGYTAGVNEKGFRLAGLVETKAELRSELESLREAHRDSQQRLIAFERGTSMDEHALNQARRTIAALETRISDLRADLTFYRNIMAPSETSTGLQVDQLTLRPDRSGDGYSFKLVLTQIGNNKNYISGVVAVNVIGRRDGEKEVIALRDLSQDIDELGIKFRFRYFQDIEGGLSLPDGFEPLEVQAVAQAKGARSTKAERTFDWATLTEK
ncbi:DUF6776 family protein [Marinobacter sp.]|uniref:DUF6776 family protein n=1 Tax=Marinobacter sp. TaxID=50741 RepID=UPI00384A6998